MIFKGVEICCPRCHADLVSDGIGEPALRCASCLYRYPVILGIPDMRVFPDPYIDISEDRAKAQKLAKQMSRLNFAELIEYYYSITPEVPKHHARQYMRGLFAGVARAEAALEAWEDAVGGTGLETKSKLLEVGCGTAALLVTAARRYTSAVGVDIAFRWLMVAKKRLMDAGLDIPLICACAEALPFEAGSFDRIVADSVIEHVRDQQRALQECYRVARAGGHLFISTPNKYSLGPDPHTGLWAGGLLPQRWSAVYVRWRGGIPPWRHLLSAAALRARIRDAGFGAPRLFPPDISYDQRRHYERGLQRLIDFYQAVKRRYGMERLLLGIGPLLHAVAQKPRV